MKAKEIEEIRAFAKENGFEVQEEKDTEYVPFRHTKEMLDARQKLEE